MKILAISAIFVMLSTSAFAQPAAKSTVNAAGLGKSTAVSNEELNIRAYIELLRSDVKKSKAQVMGEVMQLDTEQATKFWPIYKEFEAELSTLGDQVVTVVKRYAATYDKMTDSIADELGTQVLGIEQQRNELKKKYYSKFKGNLGAIMATRFLQVENQLERLIDLQTAAELPVIDAR